MGLASSGALDWFGSLIKEGWNATTDFFQGVGQKIEEGWIDLNNWGANVKNDLSRSLYFRSFEGISAQGVEELKSQISRYCDQLESKIKTFNADGQINNSIRGAQLEQAVREFVTAIKELLAAYVSVMRQNVSMATQAYQAYENVQKNVAKNVQSNAEAIRKEANSVKIDG